MAALYPPRVFPGCRITAFGTSRTFLDWMGTLGQVGQLKALIEATWVNPGHAAYGRPAVGSGTKAIPQLGSIPSVQPAAYPTVTISNRGVSGSRIADLDGTVAAGLAASTPDLAIIEHSTNDINGLVGPATDPAVFTTSYLSVIDKCLAYRSTLPIVVVSDWCYGEYYLSSPARWNSLAPINPDVPSSWSLNTTLQAIVAARPNNCTYADVCTPLLAWLMANYGPPGPGTGAATSDGLHENTTGAQLISQFVKPFLAIDP